MGLFDRMLGVCAAAGDFFGAERILQRVIKSSLEPNTLTFALVVSASAEARDVVRAELWLKRLFVTGVYADVGSHPEVISSLVDAGAAELARAAQAASQQDVTSSQGGEQSAQSQFSSVLHALRKQWQLSQEESADIMDLWEEVLQKHRSEGLLPSPRVLHALLQVLARCNRSREIEAVLKDMASVGLRADPVTYGVLIEGASARKDVAQAEAYFEDAQRKLVEPSLPMLNSLIKGCAAAADVLRAKKWFERIYSEGLAPNALSFNSLLGACGTAGADREAESVLQDMVNAELRPDGYSYLALIKASGHKSGKQAEHWFATAVSARVQVDTGMYNAVLRAYVAHGEDAWEVKRIYADMERRGVPGNAATFLSLAHAHAAEGEVSKVEDFIYGFREQGHALGRDEYACLLRAYSKKQTQRSHKAERLFRQLVAEKIVPTATMLRHLRLAMGEAPAEALLEELRVESEASPSAAPAAESAQRQ